MNITMKKMNSLILIAAFALQAQASLVDFGTYTNDTSTNLDWLDMTFTHWLSYNEVNAALSGSLSGWRFATNVEFDSLINSAVGAPYAAHYYDPAIYSEMKNLSSLLGSTYYSPTSGYGFTVGYVDSSSLSFADSRQFGYDSYRGFVRPGGAFEYNWDTPKDSGSPQQGSFLVRSSGPSSVPDLGSTAFLLVVAFLGFTGFKRR